MNPSLLSSVELKNHTLQQFYSLEGGLSKKKFSLNEIGSILPGSVMVQDLKLETPSKVTYMNNWGCERLSHSLKDIQNLGEEYYSKFFVQEQIVIFREGISAYFERNDCSTGYHFFQQVRTGKKQELEWYFTMCKFFETEMDLPSKLLVISNPISGSKTMSRMLDGIVSQDLYRTKNFTRFSLLTKREKEIIVLLAEGKSTKDISGLLFLSSHTVETHRKNIRRKLEINSLAELIKFAIAFDLISY